MKRAELEIGKAYYLSTKTDWSDGSVPYNKRNNKTQIAIYLGKYNKVIVKETQLKTEAERKYRTNQVLVQLPSGREEWVKLSHLRGEFKVCIDQIFKRNHKNEGEERGERYAKHLRQKYFREVYRPAIDEMLKEMRRVSGSYISEYDKVGSLPLSVAQVVTEALSKLETADK